METFDFYSITFYIICTFYHYTRSFHCVFSTTLHTRQEAIALLLHLQMKIYEWRSLCYLRHPGSVRHGGSFHHIHQSVTCLQLGVSSLSLHMLCILQAHKIKANHVLMQNSINQSALCLSVLLYKYQVWVPLATRPSLISLCKTALLWIFPQKQIIAFIHPVQHPVCSQRAVMISLF